MSHDIDIIHGNRLKTGNTEPTFRAQLYEDGYPFNLDQFQPTTVTLKLRRSDADTNKVEEEMVITDANRGLVSYQWVSSDTDEDGAYRMEIEATNGTKTITWPSTGYERMYISKRI